MIGGLIAAAGASARMGRPKALLPIGDSCFVAHLARALLEAGVHPVVVTVPEGPSADDVQAVLRGLDVVTSPNREPAAGLSGSVATALERLGDVEALLLCPVDMPFVDASLVHALATALVEPARAAVPVVDDALGHPALFHRSLFAALREAGPRGGPRAVLAATTVARVPWSDARVLADLNTPAAFEAAFSRP